MKITVLVIGILGLFASSAQAEYTIEKYRSSNSYSVGIEGFHETYKEPIASLVDTANYGSITANWTHYFVPSARKQYFFGLDGRTSYSPKDNYESISGTSSGDTQREFDLRLLSGIRYNNTDTESLSVFSGLGLRYYRDEGKGIVTNLGAAGYDRRISQIYIPLGLTYNITTDSGWVITPSIEGDLLVNGTVETRLQNLGGEDLKNTQGFASGYALRAELMIGLHNSSGVVWQVGPFVRYWNVSDSDSSCDSFGSCGYEPKNSRAQYGAELRLKW